MKEKGDLQIILDSVPACVFYKDKENRFIRVNEAFCKVMGLSKDQLEGKTLWDLYSKQEADAFWKDDLAVIQSGEAKRNIIEMLALPDRVLWVQTDKIPYKNEQDETIGIIGFATDITDRKRAEDFISSEESRLRAITGSAQDAILMINHQGKISFVNPATEKIFGYSSDEMINANLHLLLAPERYHSKHALAFAHFIKTGQGEALGKTLELEARKKDGNEISIELSLSPMKLADGWSAVGIIRDITERKKLEGILRESEERLRELNATKDKFFSIIAHDLKSPFNSLIGFSNLLAEQVREKNYQGIEEYSRIIGTSANRVLNLVTNLLDWSQTQTGGMGFNPEYIEIKPLINDVVELLNDNALQKAISISMDVPLISTIFADRAMVSTILRNLISNSIKFTNPGGKVEISVKQSPGQMIFSVSDNGVGIAKENIGNIFRLEESTSTPGTHQETGTGLGLILSREFVEKHNGTIGVESEVGKGSRFYFTIPGS